MLKALELVGFKSFADRTRFEFPAGITVVVGPNGSGKSNIVDAIKWALGEQSVKSLRGQEMADVIFNGSGTRRAMNSAEITLTFDNSSRLLAVDSPEVHITRRVYRSGEGEYLINRAPARLRDIRELLSGTGMGTQAYSVIEQGKVDVLLQSSARDRRAIFEEAAGISRFKLKKLEALRRLERLEQNLLRLRDIVDEVENQLRSVRNQAGKARRYKEYSDRLQELRTQVALGDWRRLSESVVLHEREVAAEEENRVALTAAAETAEAQLLVVDTQLTELGETMRQVESQVAQVRERIAGHEAAIEHERARLGELEQETARHRAQWVALHARDGDLGQQLQETMEAVQTAEASHQNVTLRILELERTLSELIARHDRTRAAHDAARAAYMEQFRLAGGLASELGALESRAQAAAEAGRRIAARLAELDAQQTKLDEELDRLRGERRRREDDVEERLLALSAAEEQLEHQRSQLRARQRDLVELQQRHAAAAERAAVLEELEQRQEGLSAGVKEVLEKARRREEPFQDVSGLVADLLQVSVEVAPLVEVALGPAAQHVVVAPNERMQSWLVREARGLGGRVGFLWLPDAGHDEPLPPIDLEGRPGVLGRADCFIETAPRHQALARRLLGRTWFVETLEHALALREAVAAVSEEAVHFVTLAGEWVGADGALLVGPPHAGVGLISRRSQLRALKLQLAEDQSRITAAQQAAALLERQIAAEIERVRQRTEEHRAAAAALGEQRLLAAAVETRATQFAAQHAELSAEAEKTALTAAETTRHLSAKSAALQAAQAHMAELEVAQAGHAGLLGEIDSQRQAAAADATEAKVELAKSEERLGNLHARLKQFEESRQERRRAIGERLDQLSQCARRAEASRWNILRAESEIAELYLGKETYARQSVAAVESRESLRQQRDAAAADAQRLRGRVRKADEKLHARQLALNEVLLQRTALADRFRDEYAQELAALDASGDEIATHERAAVQQEIDDLRRKISNLGNVNLEALEELSQLEGRYAGLFAQYNDLSSAKTSLERIIAKINADSRRLFAETLETVRGHFQTLFRDLFGGGQADIVLDEGVDILESGIEIVARPPGKEPRNISLLSGGEKTMTCVAMLLAIFRSRPSPFCVLDEVDAALDEANIDRFTQVLHGFLAWTQFIIVTHSKKTMTCANTIYGVTMQESGVSKQVSVRFEDVSDDGHIRPERLQALEAEAAGDDDAETQAA